MKKNIEKISRRKFAKKISSTVLYTSSILGVSMFERSLYAELEKQKKRPLSFGKAKAVIQVWMWGGPCHIDTFDPKPDAGYDFCGPYNSPIATNVDGIRIGQLMQNLAKCADKYSIL